LKIKEFDPQKDKIDRMILEQVISVKTKVRGGVLINSTTNQEPSSLQEDPGPNYSSLL
jgi:hypothetical protein